MVRTQIQLTEIQTTRLKKLAVERDVSLAELIRQAIDRFLTTEERAAELKSKRERAKSAIGDFRADVSDLSINHDYYFAEAISDYPRVTPAKAKDQVKVIES